MKKKLTLSIDSEILIGAKRYAKLQESSLSHIIENYLRLLTKDIKEKSKYEAGPIVKSLRGAFKSSKDFNYKSELLEAISKKHL